MPTLMIAGRPLEEYLTSPGQNNFQLVRLLAASMVVETHSHILFYDDSRIAYLNQPFHLSFLGLPAFFFLSGLLVTQSFFKSSSSKNFLWKRFLRIYPAAWFCLLTTAFIMGPAVTTLPLKDYFSSPQLYRLLVSLSLFHTNLYLPGVFTHSVLGTSSTNASLWTISLELKLYLALTFAGPVIKKIPAAKHLLLPVIVSAVAFYGWKNPSIPSAVKPWCTYGVQFLSGVACYLYRDKIIIRPFLILLLPFLFFLSFRLHIYFYTAYLLIPATVILSGTFAVTQLHRITPAPDLSYGIYIFAFPIQQLIANYILPSGPIQFFLLSMAAIIPVAIISWYGIEKRALGLKNRVSRRHPLLSRRKIPRQEL